MIELLDPPLDWVTKVDVIIDLLRNGKKVGFTLTGNEETPTVSQRISVMRKLAVNVRVPVFAKVEPITDFASSLAAILEIADFCKDIRVGVSLEHNLDRDLCDRFVDQLTALSNAEGINIRWGESISQLLRTPNPQLTN